MSTRTRKSQSGPTESPAMTTNVLIVGGGLVGLSQAIALAASGISVVVVDNNPPGTDVLPEFDGRASAIAQGPKRALDHIGVWQHLPEAPAPIPDIRISDQQSLFFLHYDHNDLGLGPLGFMIENRHLRMALHQRCQQLASKLKILAPDRVASFVTTPSSVEARLSSGQTVAAQLMIAADGRSSPTRTQAGITTTGWQYPQTAIVCTVKHDISHDFIAHEHFLSPGPFAILPLNGDRLEDGAFAGNMSSIVWTEHSDLADAIMAAPDDVFMDELKQRFGSFLGALTRMPGKFSYPLGLQIADRVTDNRLVIIGDAAHGMHPIAGQGLNMGLRDVAALSDVLSRAHQLGQDLGTATLLEKYSRWRRLDNGLMLAATDGINRLFSNSFPPVKIARDLGLGLVQQMPPLKKFFMKSAMGLIGDLPSLMRDRP